MHSGDSFNKDEAKGAMVSAHDFLERLWKHGLTEGQTRQLDDSDFEEPD